MENETIIKEIQKPVTPKYKSFGDFIAKNKMLTAFLIALIAIAVIWFWKNYQIEKIKDASQKQYAEKQYEALKLLAKPYVWAVRKEMLTKNYQQINLYAADMIHEKNFQSIMVSDADGLIISSTEKKSEGQNIKSFVNPDYLSADSATINKINDSVVVINSPIMGFNNRLGTLTIYKKMVAIKY